MNEIFNMKLSNKDKAQAEHFWKMLDEMASSNPEV